MNMVTEGYYEPYSKLRGRIVEIYGTDQQFSKELEIYKNSLSLKLNGKTGVSQSDIVIWCRLLQIDIHEIGIYFFNGLV